jgi:hypothetical protein
MWHTTPWRDTHAYLLAINAESFQKLVGRRVAAVDRHVGGKQRAADRALGHRCTPAVGWCGRNCCPHLGRRVVVVVVIVLGCLSVHFARVRRVGTCFRSVLRLDSRGREHRRIGSGCAEGDEQTLLVRPSAAARASHTQPAQRWTWLPCRSARRDAGQHEANRCKAGVGREEAGLVRRRRCVRRAGQRTGKVDLVQGG